MSARVTLSLAFVAIAMMLAPSRACAQETAYRFEITRVGDSTIVLSTGHHDWVRQKQKGIAVDPMRHDALVARFMILSVNRTDSSAIAVVTGQTTQLTPNHVALITRPTKHWYAQPVFWIGAVLGGAIGAIAAH
ncbi:MAG: hypothetical protein ACRENC_11335 [Gemmatimonadaceae bacterium]